jgi:hypothetical protein
MFDIARRINSDQVVKKRNSRILLFLLNTTVVPVLNCQEDESLVRHPYHSAVLKYFMIEVACHFIEKTDLKLRLHELNSSKIK